MLNPKIAPKLPPEQQRAPVPPWLQQVTTVYSRRALPALAMAAAAPGKALQAGAQVSRGFLLRSLGTALVPVLFALVTLGGTWWYVVIHSQADNIAQVAAARAGKAAAPAGGGLQGPAAAGGVQEPVDTGVKEPPAAEGSRKEPSAEEGLKEPPTDAAATEPAESGGLQAPPGSEDAKPAAAAADAPLQEIGEPSGSGPQTAPVPRVLLHGLLPSPAC